MLLSSHLFSPSKRFASSAVSVRSSVLKLLKSFAGSNDLQEYLKLYGDGKPQYAVVKVGGEVIQKELDVFADSLAQLHAAGLTPVVVHGAGPQMNIEVEKQGIQPQYVGGMRVTDAATLQLAQRVFRETNATLCSALELRGVQVVPLNSGVFTAKLRDQIRLGFVGDVTGVARGALDAALASGKIPVIAPIGADGGGQALNINADVAARELALTVQPLKTIMINAKGGWIEAVQDGGDGKTVLPEIVLSRDYARMKARNYEGRQGTLLKLEELKQMLDGMQAPGATVALTSAANLGQELFLHRGSGTTVRRQPLADALGQSQAGTAAQGASANQASGTRVAATDWIRSEGTRNGQRVFRVAVVGARGYVGRELIRLIGQHPQLQLVAAASRALVGQSVLEMAAAAPEQRPGAALPHTWNAKTRGAALAVDPALHFSDIAPEDVAGLGSKAAEVDVWVLALPNGLCDAYAAAIGQLPANARMPRGKPVVLDLSADQRFDDTGAWTYGLPELPGARERLRTATHIANPGCYATGAQLALLPLLPWAQKARGLQPGFALHPDCAATVFGVSGYSGAGTSPSDKNDPARLHENLIGYAAVGHIHEREVARQLRLRPGSQLGFSPHVAEWFQGISLTASARLAPSAAAAASPAALAALFEEFYRGEPLVRLAAAGAQPTVRDVSGRHHVLLGGFASDNDKRAASEGGEGNRRVVVTSCLDNLLKGAATQALQNINIALGLSELEGISDATASAEDA